MLRYQKAKRILSLVMSIFMVMGCFAPNVLSQNKVYASQNEVIQSSVGLAEKAMSKIEPQVMDDFNNEELVEVMVYMNSQVDTEMVAYETQKSLSATMTPYQTKLQVRRNVVEALRDNAETAQANIINYLNSEMEKGNVEDFETYTIVNMLYVKATKEVVESLAYMAEVGKIYKNKTHTLDVINTEDADIQPAADGVEWNISNIRADEAWELGYDGTGVVVGILDTGVDWRHPALKNNWRGFDPDTGAITAAGNWFDPVYNAELPADSGEHGTHVLGTMVGQEPDGSNKVGVAPGAKWIGARIFDTTGYTSDAILLAAADWMLHPGGNPDLAPDVVNNSWGGGAGINDWYRDAVRAWRAAGIVPIFAAGNQVQGEPAPWPGSISIPANYPESIAVAALDINNNLASFSKLGPSPYDETLIKPNVGAGGVNVRSSVPGGGYAGLNGTSMAAPAVSGAVALILSANASLSVDEIENLLQNTAVPLTDSKYPTAPNMGFGYGIIDAFEAVASVESGTGYISGRVFVQGEDTAEATIEHEQQIFEAYMGSNIEILAQITDDVAVTEAELLVKQQGKSYWMVVPMTRISGDHNDGMYKGVISGDMVRGDQITYKIKVRDFADDVVVSRDYDITVIFGVIPGEYTQGFEEDLNGWTLDGSWEHGAPSAVGPTAYEGEKVLATTIDGNYPNSSNSWLIAPPIDLRDTSLETASLRFYEWSNMAYNDFGNLLITNDFGATWTPARAAITGIRTEWKEAMVNLKDYIGSANPVFVAFNFTSNASGQAAGWYIDNVRLLAADYEAPAVPSNLTIRVGLEGINLNWKHSPDADLSHYNIYRSETEGEGYIKIADTINNSYMDAEVTVDTTYYYVVTAEDLEQKESAYSAEVSATAVEAITIFATDFEENDGGFTTAATKGANPWAWGIPTTGPMAAMSGEKLWATNLDGVYQNNTDSYIETPAIVVPEDKDAVLLFNHWVDMEGTAKLYDYGQVLISKDDGATWTNITPVAGAKYSKRVQGWTNEKIFLNGCNGQTIKIRFLFHTDFSGVYEGWYIDDVAVMGIDYVAPEPIDEVEITYDDGIVDDYMMTGIAGDGLAVKFTPAQVGKVQAAKIYLSINPLLGKLGFAIYDANQNLVGDPIYVDNVVLDAWNLIDLSSINFVTGSDFYISTIQDGFGADLPLTGLDHNPASDRERSYVYVNGEFTPLIDKGPNFQAALMLRAIVDYSVREETVVKTSSRNIDSKAFMFNETSSVNEVGEPPVREAFNYRINVDGQLSSIIDDLEVQNMPMVFAGIPTPNAVVTIKENGRSIKVDPVTGKFTMRAPVGTYTLIAEAYGCYPMEQTIVVEEDQTVKANFILEQKPQGTITGQVFDRYFGTPAAYAVIRVAEDPKISPVIADANGNFVIENVYIGEYTLKVVADGFESGEARVTVAGNETTNVEIKLKGFLRYEDEIVYDDGVPKSSFVVNSAGSGLAVRFTPDQYVKVKGANIYFWDSSYPTPGGNRIGFAIYGVNEDGQSYQVGDSIFQDIVRGEWNYIDLSGFEFETDRDFYISTIQDADGKMCPAVGFDNNPPLEGRSYVNLGGSFITISSQGFDGSLMIRAKVDYAMGVPVITNIPEHSYTNQDLITVEGIMTGDGITNVYVNDVMVTSVQSENRMFTAQVELTAEVNTIRVSAEINGLETEPSAPVVVVKNKVAPELTVVNPVDNAKVKVDLIHVIGTVSDDIQIATLTVNGKAAVVAADGSFDERVRLINGANVITVVATDHAGNATTIVRTVVAELQAPAITNILPNQDVTLSAGQTLTVSFNAPAGGQGFFRLMIPFGLQNEDRGIPMVDNDGLYTGTWTVPEGTEATSLLIEVVYISESGYEITEIANSKVTVVGNIQDLAPNSVIIGTNSYDIEYLNNDASAQAKLIEWISNGGTIYIKINGTDIVAEDGQQVSIEVLPDFLTHFDANGEVTYYEK